MVTVVEATPDRWVDLVEVMGTRGDPATCWCQWFRLRNADFVACTVEQKREALRGQVHAAIAPGVLAYDADGIPRGWCAIAPRDDLPRLNLGSDAGVWAITCFVVRVGSRRKGISAALLDGAINVARRHGAGAVEAYPFDTSMKKVSSADLYVGALSVFLRAGFEEVGARRLPHRPTVRLTLPSAG